MLRTLTAAALTAAMLGLAPATATAHADETATARAGAATGWHTVVKLRRAKAQVCRETADDGSAEIYFRHNGRKATRIARTQVTTANANTMVFVGKSGWIRPGNISRKLGGAELTRRQAARHRVYATVELRNGTTRSDQLRVARLPEC